MDLTILIWLRSKAALLQRLEALGKDPKALSDAELRATRAIDPGVDAWVRSIAATEADMLWCVAESRSLN